MTLMRVSAPAKLIIFGEYLVLLGHDACGIILPLHLSISFKSKDCELDIRSHVRVDDEFYSHIKKVCKKFKLEELRGICEVESSIPKGVGLGSSAAFCSCIAQLLCIYNTRTQEHSSEDSCEDSFRVWKIAHSLEQYFHSNASGVDTALSIFGARQDFMATEDSFEGKKNGRIILIEKSQHSPDTPNFFYPSPLNISLEGQLEYAAVERNRPNKETIHNTIERIKKGELQGNTFILRWIEKHTQAILQLRRLHSASHEVSEIQYAAIKELARYCTEIQACLTHVGLSTLRVDQVIKTSIRRGALGAKLSGAGYGGALCVLKARGDTHSYLRQIDNEDLLLWGKI